MDTKITKSNNLLVGLKNRFVAGLLVLGFVVLLSTFLPFTVRAASQSYATRDKTITKGMAVAVISQPGSSGGTTSYVQKSSVKDADKTVGVVVNLGDNLVTSVSGDYQIFVASSGEALVYVTNLNGAVKKGDLLAPSPLEGVLMRASDGTPGILGAAMDDFSAQEAQTVSVRGSEAVKIASLHINMDVKFATSSAGVQQSLLERLGQSVAHRQVNSLQAFIGLAILILLIVVEGGIVYAAISSSILSLGRNPLAKRTIMRGLLQASLLVLAVLAVGIASIYLVLRA